ncbi:MAG: C2H2-type zinc finger protein [Mycoplasma sp.]|nr:C2H2-type zinc finger protein [Mycoplasma sp.]
MHKCDDCPQHFVNKWNLNHHRRKAHHKDEYGERSDGGPGPKTSQTNRINKSNSRLRELAIAASASLDEDPDELIFDCPYCSKKFKTPGYLNGHLRNAHDPALAQPLVERRNERTDARLRRQAIFQAGVAANKAKMASVEAQQKENEADQWLQINQELVDLQKATKEAEIHHPDNVDAVLPPLEPTDENDETLGGMIRRIDQRMVNVPQFHLDSTSITFEFSDKAINLCSTQQRFQDIMDKVLTEVVRQTISSDKPAWVQLLLTSPSGALDLPMFTYIEESEVFDPKVIMEQIARKIQSDSSFGIEDEFQIQVLYIDRGLAEGIPVRVRKKNTFSTMKEYFLYTR